MIFLPVLSCENCHQSISLPLPIQREIAPRQIAWPWSALSGNFLCQSCWKMNTYLSQDCRWNGTQSTDLVKTTIQTAIYRISVPCDTLPCVGLLHILAVMPLGFDVAAAASLLTTVELNGITCDNGHPNYGSLVPKEIGSTSISVTRVTESWE